MTVRTLSVKWFSLSLMLIVSNVSAQDSPASPYSERPLNFPSLGTDGQCPVSIGELDIVPPNDRYMFMGGAHFFGSGPVYFGLSWKPSDRAEGYFELVERIPKTSDGYRLKTPWIMHPDYYGEALVRGAEIGPGDPRRVLFDESSQIPSPTESMVLHSLPDSTRQLRTEAHSVDELWGFWPSSMNLPESGCYAIQIDTETGSDVVVFEAREVE